MFIIGHRGARAVQPENTVAALKEGIKCSDFVEVDVRLTKDGIPVVMHDATLDRTTDGKGLVAQKTFREIQEFDAGDGRPIPTLQDVCTLCLPTCGIMVEIKEPGSEDVVCRILREYDPESFWIVSFYSGSIRAAKKLLPAVKAGLICSADCTDLLSPVLAAGADGIIPRSDTVLPEMVAEAHRQRLMVIIWTLNSPESYRRAAGCGADGWVTDDPCHLRNWVNHSLKDRPESNVSGGDCSTE